MRHVTLVVSALFVASLASCDSSSGTNATVAAFDLQALANRFEPGSIIRSPRLVDCKLSEGSSTTCVSFTLPANPKTFEMGPWCPTNVSDGAARGGIWLDDGKVHAVDGSFVENLANHDPAWRMYDPQTGAVNVTDTPEACAAAARPDVDPRYRNYCVQCLASYIQRGLTNTYVIPVQPGPATRLEPRVGRGGVGVAFRGVRLDAPAPLDAMLRRLLRLTTAADMSTRSSVITSTQ